MNPKYNNGIEAYLNDIVSIDYTENIPYGDNFGGTYSVNHNNVLAKVIDFFPESKKCFMVKLNTGKVLRLNKNQVKLADYRNLI